MDGSGDGGGDDDPTGNAVDDAVLAEICRFLHSTHKVHQTFAARSPPSSRPRLPPAPPSSSQHRRYQDSHSLPNLRPLHPSSRGGTRRRRPRPPSPRTSHRACNGSSGTEPSPPFAAVYGRRTGRPWSEISRRAEASDNGQEKGHDRSCLRGGRQSDRSRVVFVSASAVGRHRRRCRCDSRGFNRGGRLVWREIWPTVTRGVRVALI